MTSVATPPAIDQRDGERLGPEPPQVAKQLDVELRAFTSEFGRGAPGGIDPFACDPAVGEREHAVGDVLDGRVVRDDQRGRAELRR